MTRVLLIRLSAMGDVVQTLGAVEALHEARPDLELWYVTQRGFEPLLANLPWIAGVVRWDRHAGVGDVMRVRASMRELEPALAFDLQGNWKSALFARLSGAPGRVGAGKAWRREPSSRMLLNGFVDVPGTDHPTLVATAVLRHVAPDLPVRLPRLIATDGEVEIAASDVRGCGIDAEKPFRVHVLTDPADIRSQQKGHSALEQKQSRLPVLWLAGPADGAALAPSVGPLLRQKRGELRQLIGIGALVARLGGEVVGPDTGATHVLAACGARTTVLFGAQDPARTMPPAARVLQHPEPPTCMPCRAVACHHPKGPVCMAFTTRDGREFSRPEWLPPASPLGSSS